MPLIPWWRARTRRRHFGGGPPAETEVELQALRLPTLVRTVATASRHATVGPTVDTFAASTTAVGAHAMAAGARMHATGSGHRPPARRGTIAGPVLGSTAVAGLHRRNRPSPQLVAALLLVDNTPAREEPE